MLPHVDELEKSLCIAIADGTDLVSAKQKVAHMTIIQASESLTL